MKVERRHQPSLTMDYDDDGIYRNPCIGMIFYAGKYRQLFKYQYTPKGYDDAPEYVLVNGYRRYIKPGKSSETEPYSHNGCASRVY